MSQEDIERQGGAPDSRETSNVVPLNGAAHASTDTAPKMDDGEALIMHRQNVLINVAEIGESLDTLLQAVAKIINAEIDYANMLYQSGEPERVAEAEAMFNILEKAAPQQWCDIANMNLRQGLMFLRRALEQPTTF